MANTIDIRDLRFTYAGSVRPAVDGVSFAVRQNEVFGFLGPSGPGTSTTQNILIRLLDGYTGEISVLGQALRTWDRSYYRRIGIAFEPYLPFVAIGLAVAAVTIAGTAAAFERRLLSRP